MQPHESGREAGDAPCRRGAGPAARIARKGVDHKRNATHASFGLRAGASCAPCRHTTCAHGEALRADLSIPPALVSFDAEWIGISSTICRCVLMCHWLRRAVFLFFTLCFLAAASLSAEPLSLTYCEMAVKPNLYVAFIYNGLDLSLVAGVPNPFTAGCKIPCLSTRHAELELAQCRPYRLR